MDILQAAATLRPGVAWNYDGQTLSQALDGTPRVTVPTTAELDAVMQANAYKELRRMAYPSVGDQLDALWKGGQAADDMRAIINAVKAQFPKP